MVFLGRHGMRRHLEAISVNREGFFNRRTEIDLLLEAVGLEGLGDTCDEVRKSKLMRIIPPT